MTLWCMYTLGPDDVQAAPSKEDAELAVRCYTEWYENLHAKEFKDDRPYIRFVVAEWPHSAESHAESVKKWHTDVLTPEFTANHNSGGQ